MADLAQLIQPHILNLAPYSSARDEYTGDLGVFLDANENPFGSVDGTTWNRYPDPHHAALRASLSKIKQVDKQSIFVGNGSDEPIDLLIRLFCRPEKDHVLIFPPTYGMYQVAASIQNVGVKKVLLNSDFQLDIPAIEKSWTAETKITFICSPNNPTGNLIDQNDILFVLKNAPGIVVVDEAYIDFAPDQTSIQLLDQFANLVVLQTLSKAWGLAALRLGMAFSSAEINHYLYKIKSPYNLNGQVQKQILSALRFEKEKNHGVDQVRLLRKELVEDLSQFSFVQKIYLSDSNFILAKFERAQEVFDYLIKNKVIVRNRSNQPLCDNCLRITVGTKDENATLIKLLKSLKFTQS